MLNDAIDRIAGRGATPESAEGVAASLGGTDVLAAAIIHLAALVDDEPTRVDGELVLFGQRSLRLVPSAKQNTPIRYDDVSVGFDIEGDSVSGREGPSELWRLLSLYEYARDHSGSVLLLPIPLRRQRISEIANEAGASERFTRFILAKSPRLMKAIAE